LYGPQRTCNIHFVSRGRTTEESTACSPLSCFLFVVSLTMICVISFFICFFVFPVPILVLRYFLFLFDSGNDDAAGHGNFFNEQYTVVLQDRAEDMFDRIGLRLITRPFARSGATSAPELAACAKEIYGTDIDIITWDFGMTDGRTHWRIEFFAHRVHILPNHPVLLVLQAGIDPARQELVEHLTNQGMTTLRQDEKYLIDRALMFPDSKGKSENELAEMTDYTRYFRCGYGIETGAECGTNRFTQNGTCDDRENMKNWHHGWWVHNNNKKSQMLQVHGA